MNKKVTLIVALGCIYAGAANTVNYDLLGRRGSKMNSPMVYKNIDYSKMEKKKQEVIGAPLDNKALMKRGSGLLNGIVALEGAYCNKGLDNTTNYPVPFYLKRCYANGCVPAETFDHVSGSNGYMAHSNMYFKPVPRWSNYSPNYTVVNTNSFISGQYSITDEYYPFNNSNTYVPSHYGYQQDSIRYLSLSPEQRDYISKRWAIQSWYDTPNYGNNQEFGKVGVHMTVDARPVRLNNDDNAKPTFVQLSANNQFTPTPITEVASSRMYNTIKAIAKEPVIYVGKNSPAYPANPSWMGSQGPQIYVGVHAGIEPGADDSLTRYRWAARDLDNYIYDNRTIEIVGAGNYAVRFNNKHLASRAHASNAITVGAADGYSFTIAGYTSNISRYCTQGFANCSSLRDGSKKPEIYNYAHFYMNDLKRTYNGSDGNWVYPPLYDGTEVAAAYTAGMVADLLTVNPFYRWHPEVVKALLITSGDNALNTPYPHTPVTTAVPTYQTLLFDKDHQNEYHYSRYWIGDINMLKTHVENSRKEIRFSVKRPEGKTHFSAAISWLTSGRDIATFGKIAQDFDLEVYERNTDNIDNLTGSSKAYSGSLNNSFEKVSFTSSAQYLMFRIQLYSENSATENKDQVVLGFDLAAAN